MGSARGMNRGEEGFGGKASWKRQLGRPGTEKILLK
jgi:hypothetical protein